VAAELQGALLLWQCGPLRNARFPPAACGAAAWEGEEEGWQGGEAEVGALRVERAPYLVVTEEGAGAVVVPPRRGEVLPLAVAGLCEGGHALRAGALLLACTDAHPLLRTRRAALVALQVRGAAALAAVPCTR